MRILLVYPPVFRTVDLYSSALPIGMLQVGQYLLDQGHEVQALNLEIGGAIQTRSILRMRRAYADTDLPAVLSDPEAAYRRQFRERLLAFRPDIVGISCATEQADAARRLEEDVRTYLPSARVEYGGMHHPSSAWAREVSLAARMADPALDLLAHQNPPASFGAILTSLGCPFECSFCGSPRQYGRKLVEYPIDQVRRRIERSMAMGADQIHLMDDSITLREARAREIADLMHDIGVPWRTQTRVDMVVRRPQLVAYFRERGCRQLTFGVESGSPRILQQMRKRITPDQVLACVAILNRAGLPYTANFMVGFPGETNDDVAETRSLIDAMAPQRVLAGSVVPYPGTAVHDENPAFVEAAKRWPASRWSPFDGGFLCDEAGNRIQGPDAATCRGFFDHIEGINDHAPTAGTFSTVSSEGGRA